MEKVTGGLEVRADGGRIDSTTLFPVATLTGRIGNPLPAVGQPRSFRGSHIRIGRLQ
jgi:hypothetical protein